MSFAMTPYQHGVIRVLKETNKFDSEDEQFQGYKFWVRDLSELVAKEVIRYVPRSNTYVCGVKFDSAL